MKKHLLILLSFFVFVVWYFPIAIPVTHEPIGYSTVPDSDADYLVSLRVSRFEKLYSDFSILYPPGRFFVQGLLFHLMSPSYMILAAWHALVTMVFFPAALFVLTFYFLNEIFTHQFFKKYQLFSSVLAYFLAILSSFLYLLFIRSAQEIHVISALFLSVLLLPGKMTGVKKFVLGLLFGLAFLFRIDGGIVLLIALLVNVPLNFREKTTRQLNHAAFFLLGFFVVWVPTLLLITFHGSLQNFLYDTLVLGLLIQPKFMSLPIPANELGRVWLSSLIFLFSTSLALFIDAVGSKNNSRGLRVVAVVSLISYVSGLGRADEPHLWYGLIWIPLLLLYTFYRIIVGIVKKEQISIFKIIFFTPVFFLYALLVLKLKSPNFFLVSSFLIFIFFRKRKTSILSILISGLIACLLVFHSISYLKLIYSFPGWPPPYRQVEMKGISLQYQDELILRQIRADIPPEEEYLFIFPKNVLLNEFVNLRNPTRYIILTNERSDKTEREVIDQLIQTKTNYFLVFPEAAELRKGLVWEWILENTVTTFEYELPGENAELRLKK